MAPAALARLRVLGALLAVILLSWITYETVHAGSDIPPPPPEAVTHLSGGTASDKRLDGKAWSLDYASATMSPDGSTADIEHIRDGLILRNGKPFMHMKAEHVTANTAINDFTAVGPVSFTEIGGQHRSLRTNGAHYVGFSQTLILSNRTLVRANGVSIVVDHATVDFANGNTTFGRIVGTL